MLATSAPLIVFALLAAATLAADAICGQKAHRALHHRWAEQLELLGERDGTRVLSPLRHDTSPPLSRVLPALDLGGGGLAQEEFVELVDCRGVAAAGAARPVVGTP